MSGSSTSATETLKPNDPFALFTMLKLACQRWRSRSRRRTCWANWRVSKSYWVFQEAVQCGVGLKLSATVSCCRPPDPKFGSGGGTLYPFAPGSPAGGATARESLGRVLVDE